ncbi:MAG: DUF29 domain-containing protein [Plectolyngbya sp. WJT66-NPBG17]|jgi:DNA-binding PucR family transcriptional regulator|nr:DUF29 domain-containing protein [Plectolyngbya sp. WJT66-NPBG17]MBW4525424.1 DUF29 domain-containing protein [Phormidium tanganyikae FI6-MK23]
MTQSLPQTSLYQQDFALWAEDTIAKLKAGKFEQLDIENLAEEIEALVSSEKRELRNRLVVLIAHILKRIYVDSTYDNRGWMLTIEEQRDAIELLLEDSPSLNSLFTDSLSKLYLDALKKVRSEYRGVDFPAEWQFSREIDSILNESFWKE